MSLELFYGYRRTELSYQALCRNAKAPKTDERCAYSGGVYIFPKCVLCGFSYLIGLVNLFHMQIYLRYYQDN